ncbi:hypothetical protein [Streptomyces sp. NPDC049040]|uniref:hypothetical protein n=1 Tax=Streptomyces sp. NPDC049040 TaxID=3365593 RepID=UPI0037178291
MRKLQQLAVVTLAVGALSAISAGVSFADTQAAPAPPQGQSQTPQGTQISPDVSPTVTLPQAPPIGSVLQGAPQAAPQEQNNLFRPYQECSPQTVLEANLPISILGQSETKGDTCTQVNHAFNN